MKHRIKTFFILLTLTAFVIHIINKFKYSLSVINNYLSCFRNNYYEWRFGKVRYIKKGNGNPILLLHDLTTGSSAYEYHKIIDTLSEDHEVYAIDFLGYGLSDKPNMTYTTYLYVQLVNDFIKNIIGKKTDIVACGDSCPITIMVCHNDPEVINKMIFVNPQNFYQSNQIPSSQTKFLKLLIDFPVLGTFIYHLYNNKNTFKKLFSEQYFYNVINIKEKDILSYLEASHYPDHTSKYVYSSYIGKYINTNFIHALKEINHSIYILSGEFEPDMETTVENYIYYNNAIESSVISYTKHLPHMEKPEKVISLINIFLNSL